MEPRFHMMTDTLDQADEEILTHTVSDEALESVTGAAGRLDPYPSFYQTLSFSDCC